MHCIKDLFKVWNKQYNVFNSLNTKNSCNEKQTYANFKNANNVLFIIYLYIFKSWSIAFIVTIFLLSHISSHIIHPFSTFFFNSFFFLLLISQLIVILSPTYYYTFSFPNSFYLPYFLLFLFPSSYYKFTILSLILHIVFSLTKSYFPLFLFLKILFFHFFKHFKKNIFLASLL